MIGKRLSVNHTRTDKKHQTKKRTQITFFIAQSYKYRIFCVNLQQNNSTYKKHGIHQNMHT